MDSRRICFINQEIKVRLTDLPVPTFSSWRQEWNLLSSSPWEHLHHPSLPHPMGTNHQAWIFMWVYKTSRLNVFMAALLEYFFKCLQLCFIGTTYLINNTSDSFLSMTRFLQYQTSILWYLFDFPLLLMNCIELYWNSSF